MRIVIVPSDCARTIYGAQIAARNIARCALELRHDLTILRALLSDRRHSRA
jgi:hypothetical protein